MKARTVYRLSVLFNSLSFVVLVGVSFRVLQLSRSPVEYHINIVEPPVYTNSFTSPVEKDLSFPPTVLSRPPSVSSNFVTSSFSPSVYRLPYSYYVSGRPCFNLFGVDYTVGSVHAYGVVSSIFPERVYFSNGGYIENSFSFRSPFSQETTQDLKIVSNENTK